MAAGSYSESVGGPFPCDEADASSKKKILSLNIILGTYPVPNMIIGSVPHCRSLPHALTAAHFQHQNPKRPILSIYRFFRGKLDGTVTI